MSIETLRPLGQLALFIVVIVIAAQIAHRVLCPVVMRLAGFSESLASAVERCRRPAQWLVPLIVLQLVLQGVPDDVNGIDNMQQLTGVLLIAAVTWSTMAAIQGLAEGVVSKHPSEAADNLAARRVQTQTRVLSRMVSAAVLVAGLAFILMTFPEARQFGASLLASAGVVGLVAGIAARSVFSNMLAGLQIALAQPIRIDDVLIVEG